MNRSTATAATLAVSFLVHVAIGLAVLWAYVSLDFPNSATIFGAISVGAVGFVKGVRWGVTRHAVFLAGLVMALLACTGLWWGFDWALTHPKPPLPPFVAHVADLLRQPQAVRLSLTPSALALLVSLGGYALGLAVGRIARGDRRHTAVE